MTAHADQARPSRTALLALAGIALLALVLGANLPAWPRILGVLNDAAHAPVFAAFAVVALLLLRDQRGGVADWHYPAAFVITVVAGIAVEWLQGQTGRDASWFDVRTDALGAIGALGAAYWRTTGEATRTRRAIGLGAAMTAATLVLLPIAEAGLAYARRAATFPTVMSFASPLDCYFLVPVGAETERRRLPTPWARPEDPTSLHVRVVGGAWPGVVHGEPALDWRNYSTLRLDVTNPGTATLRLSVRVHDLTPVRTTGVKSLHSVDVDPSSRKVVAIPLAEVKQSPRKRLLDISRVGGITVSVGEHDPTPGVEFYITRAWLE